MDRNSTQLNWSDEQWSKVLKTVADEATGPGRRLVPAPCTVRSIPAPWACRT
jgi:hypothetical protein